MKSQRGFSLVMAIFILLVLGLLGGYMVSMSAVQVQSSSYAVQGARAYQAARAGIEWAIANIYATKSCAQANQQTAMSFTGITGFTVALNCTQSAQLSEGNSSYYLFTVTSTSQYGSYGGSNYVARQIQVTIYPYP
jgi:MSHA biogenesis protein MshP